MKPWHLLAAAVLVTDLTACIAGFQYTLPVTLRHSQSGQVVRCGPYFRGGLDGQVTAVAHEARCVSDYQRQGYERIPSDER